MIMKVLSLFDGISCGMVALERANIDVESYDAYEIDKNAIMISSKNYPVIKHHGDVTKEDFKKYEGIDLLIGGSPCQGFTFSGKRLNFEDERSKLFFEFVRAKEEAKPKYFLLENVIMKKEWQDVISSFLGVEPIMINSNSFSAQNRRRLYWTNIPGVIAPTTMSDLTIKDIIEEGAEGLYQLSEKHHKAFLKSYPNWKSCSREGKSSPLLASYFKQPPHCPYIKTEHSDSGFRMLSPIECERLQTLPDNYTEGVSKCARYKALGNGWTVDVIKYILGNIEQNGDKRESTLLV